LQLFFTVVAVVNALFDAVAFVVIVVAVDVANTVDVVVVMAV
jgi:hypothetical protein